MFKEIIELKSVCSDKKTFKNLLSKKKKKNTSKKAQYQTIQSSQHIALTTSACNNSFILKYHVFIKLESVFALSFHALSI